jgi:cyclic beta-1,2-glucan synthetase
VFSQPPHVGRGGWSWYTGSAGWLYRTGLESILGLRRSGSFLTFDPCIPPHWPGFTLTYRFQSARYRIVIENPQGAERGIAEVWLDGQRHEDLVIPLADDQQTHEARVVMGGT